MFNIHSIIRESFVNGPGSRVVIWTQGCGKACKGCFNPETWNTRKNTFYDPVHLAKSLLAYKPEGITLTGGDPFEQPFELLSFLETLHNSDGSLSSQLSKGIICFTGYTLEEIEEFEGEEGEAMRKCLSLIDLLIDGRFVEELKISNILAGSSNQRFNFSSIVGRGKDLIKEEEVLIDHQVEIHINDNHEIEVTGFPNIDRQFLKDKGLNVIN